MTSSADFDEADLTDEAPEENAAPAESWAQAPDPDAESASADTDPGQEDRTEPSVG